MHAAPPDWADIVKRQSGLQVTPNQAEISAVSLQQQSVQQDFGDPANWGWMPPGDANSLYDPWTQFNDRPGPDASWWNYGNL